MRTAATLRVPVIVTPRSVRVPAAFADGRRLQSKAKPPLALPRRHEFAQWVSHRFRFDCDAQKRHLRPRVAVTADEGTGTPRHARCPRLDPCGLQARFPPVVVAAVNSRGHALEEGSRGLHVRRRGYCSMPFGNYDSARPLSCDVDPLNLPAACFDFGSSIPGRRFVTAVEVMDPMPRRA